MFLYDLSKSGVTIERLKNKQGKIYGLKFAYRGQTFKASEIGREFGYRSLQKNFEISNKTEPKKATTMADELAKNKIQSDTGYQLVPLSRTYTSPANTNENSSIAQAVGNVASTAINAAKEIISGAGELINPQTLMIMPRQHGNTGSETKPRKRRKEEEDCNHFSLSLSFPKTKTKQKREIFIKNACYSKQITIVPLRFKVSK